MNRVMQVPEPPSADALSAHPYAEFLARMRKPGRYLGGEEQQWSRSTLRRELQFLLSHTIHHFALIGLLLSFHGVEPGEEFGVAPSTLKHWRSQAECAPQPG